MKFRKAFTAGVALISLYLLPSIIQVENILGQETDSGLTATVRISVCGDGVAEADEDCDNKDLGGNKCADVGYNPGSLDCSPACEFDVSKCGDPLPTPTPTPIGTTQSNSVSADSTSTDTNSNASTNNNNNNNNAPTSNPSLDRRQDIFHRAVKTIDEIAFQIVNFVDPERKMIVESIKKFDADNDGIILITDLRKIATVWVEEFRNSHARSANCDVDHDGVCSLVDFSILMYYIR